MENKYNLRFSRHFHKGDNFCDFLFAFSHNTLFLKNGLLYEERICSLSERTVSLKNIPFFRMESKINIKRVIALESVSVLLYAVHI